LIMIYQSTLIVTLVLFVVLIVVPKKYVLLPFMIGTCFIPADQRMLIADLDFTPLRLLILAGVIRALIRSESIKQWTKFDYLVFGWAFTRTIFSIITRGSIEATIRFSGLLFDVAGMYWLFRQYIRTLSDIKYNIKILAFCGLFLSPFIALEWGSGRNPFEFMGTVQTAVREGRFRCQAACAHPIMMGVFWATLFPLFVGLTLIEEKKVLYILTVVASIFIVLSSASSTPLVVLAFEFILLFMFNLRQYGRFAVQGLCGFVLFLHIIMRGPVWHLISRIKIVSGSTGHHRYRLIDAAIKHFREWALLGTSSTEHWGRGLWDITNQYIVEGVRGGLITMILFIAIIATSAKTFNRLSLLRISQKEQLFFWCLCVAMLGHAISFMGILYIAQVRVVLFLIFAMAGALYNSADLRNVKLRSSAIVVL